MGTQPREGSLQPEVPDTHAFWLHWGLAPMEEELGRTSLGCAASAQKGASRFHQKPGSRPLLHFFSGFISLMQSICICWFCHLNDVWLVCFELHYSLECNCGESIFILLRVAANHSYMLQKIYNCLVLYVCVFNCIWEIWWRRICMIFKFIIMLHVTFLQFHLL